MRKILFTLSVVIITFIIAINISAATNYYFDATNGDDSGAGTQADPFKTLAKLDTLTLNAGDIIYLKRGEIWYESTTPNTNGASGNPVVFDAYGSGDLPIISGEAFIIGTWTNTTGNEYSIAWTSEPTEIYNGDVQLKGGVIIFNASWTASGDEYYSGTLCKWRPTYLIEDPAGTPIYYTANLGSKGSLAVNEYDCDSQGTARLYIRTSGADPSTKAAGYIKSSATKAGILNAGEYFWDASTNLLHVRLSDNSAPTSGQLSISTRTNCFQATDKSYITIKNITCKKTKEDGFLLTYTANGSNIIFDTVTTQNTGYSGIFFDAADGLTISNVTIKDSTIQYFVRNQHYKTEDPPPGNQEMGGATLGTKDSPWAGTVIFSNVSILRNNFDYGSKDISQAVWNDTMRSGTKSTLYLNRPVTFDISDNYLIGGDHQLFINATQTDLYDCGTSKIAFNNITAGYDDNLWAQGCNGNVAGDVLIYGNVFSNSGDDNMDIRNMKATIINNTLVNNSLNDGSVFATGMTDATDVIVKNNLFIRTTPLICTGNNTVCFVDMGNALSNYTFNNNLYWYDGADTDNSFYASEVADLNGVGTFADWQAQTAAPDANSIVSADPNIDSNYIPISPTPVFNMGQNMCSILQGVGMLKVGSSWTDSVETIGVCPVSDVDKFDIGAYRIKRLPN